MMKILKYLSFFAIAFVILIAGLLTWLNFVDLNQHRNALENQFTELLGRKININGDMELLVSLTPQMSLRDVHLQNAQWGSQPEMLKVGEVVLELKLLPLLFNKIDVTELSVSDLDMLIETNAHGKSNWELGKAKIATKQQGESDLQTEIILYQAVLAKANIVIKNHGEKEIHLAVDKLNVKRTGASLEEWDIAAKYNGLALKFAGSTSYIHTLLASKPFKMDLTGKLGDFNAQLKGDISLQKSNNSIGLNIDFTIATPDLEDITQLTEITMPKIGPIKLTGKIATVDGFYQLKLNADIDKINVNADGQISQKLDGQGDKINLALKAPDLALLGTLARVELPNIGPVAVTAKVASAKGFYQLKLNADVEKIRVDADGQFSQKFDGQGDKINLALKAPDLALLGTLARVELPNIGPVEVTAKVASAKGFYQLKVNADIEKIRVDADGQVSQQFDGQGDKINLALKAPDLALLGTLVRVELPDIGPVEITGNAARVNGFYQLQLNADIESIKIDANGQVSQKFDGQGDEINIALSATDLAQLGALGHVELPKVGPVDIKAKFNRLQNGYKISALDMKIDKSDIQGDLTIENKQPVFISAKLTSQLLDLKAFQQTESTDEKKQVAKSKTVFPKTPLPLEQLKLANVDIHLNVGKVQLATDEIKDIQLALKLDNSKLLLKPFQAELQGGVVKGDFLLDASHSKSKPLLVVNLYSDKLELGKFDRLKDHISGGNTKVNIDLKGSGDSISEIMAGLNGETILDIGAAKLADGSMNLLAGDMIGSLVSVLIPTENKKTGADLQCGVVRFDIKDGHALANKSIALKSKKTVMVGSGKINLQTEALNFQISSHSLGFTAVDAGDLTRSVGLGGTLANPKPILDIVGATKTGATIGAAILTLGTSYVAQKLLEAVTNDEHPCLTALGKLPQKTQPVKPVQTTP